MSGNILGKLFERLPIPFFGKINVIVGEASVARSAKIIRRSRVQRQKLLEIIRCDAPHIMINRHLTSRFRYQFTQFAKPVRIVITACELAGIQALNTGMLWDQRTDVMAAECNNRRPFFTMRRPIKAMKIAVPQAVEWEESDRREH